MSKKEKQTRELRAAKYSASVTLRRAAQSRKRDLMVLRCMMGACVVFACALVLAGVLG
jgi:hypothetical protein